MKRPVFLSLSFSSFLFYHDQSTKLKISFQTFKEEFKTFKDIQQQSCKALPARSSLEPTVSCDVTVKTSLVK